MRLAIGFENFGPYHLARLNALARHAEVLGIELHAKSTIYDWDPTKTADIRFARRTIFDIGQVPKAPREIERKISVELDRFKPEVVLIPGWASALALAMTVWCCRNRMPSVVMSESNAFDHRRNPIRERLKLLLINIHSAAFVGGSSHKDYLVRLGMAADCIETGYDVVDNAHFAHPPSGSTRPHPRRYFLASARFISIKNLDGLLRAFARARARGEMDDVDLVLLGDGAERGSLERLRTDLGLGDAVHMPGFIQYPDLPVWYGHAEAFVHVSAVEPWGLVVNEAMSAGLPVIVSRTCGAAELVQDGECGWVVDHNDIRAIADCMHILATDVTGRGRMGAAARALIAGHGPAHFGEGGLAAATHAKRKGFQGRGLVGRVIAEALIRGAV